MSPGDRVAVYRNLNRPGFFSIKALEGQNKGRVIGYAPSVEIERVTFKVSEASRQRVLRERCRNVHAWAIGSLVAWGEIRDVAGMRPVTYQPYVKECFFRRDTGAPIVTASRCVLQGSNVFVVMEP